MATAVPKQGQIKRSKDHLVRKDEKTENTGASTAGFSKLPKVKHREKKSGYLLDEGQKGRLKTQYDSLCRPSEDKEARVENWMTLHAKKDKNIREWLQSHTQPDAYPDLVRFHPEQFLRGLAGNEVDHSAALKQTNALVVSQSIFSSSGSFNAAREVVKLVAKSVIWTPEQLLEKLRRMGDLNVTQSQLEAAAADVGSNSQAIRDLLNLAADLQAPTERNEDQLAHEIQALKLALAWLDRKPANPKRSSAPTGTISLDSLRKEAKTVAIKPSPSSEKVRNTSREASVTETPPSTPRGEATRDNKSTEKSRSKTRSKSKMEGDTPSEGGAILKWEIAGAGDITRQVSDQDLREQKLKTDASPSSPQVRPANPSSQALGGSMRKEEPSTPRSKGAHFRQTSGTPQNAAVVADLNKMLGAKPSSQ